MREILFRGKAVNLHNGSKDFVFGQYVQNRDGKMIYSDTWEDGIQKHYVIEGTVGQYTGLTDKNGTKIFEGDIFKFPDEIFESYYTSCGTEYNSWEAENYGVVGFCEDLGRFDFVDYKFNENAVEADLHENHVIEFCYFVSDLEVIGNIHDNPELLKGGAE